jgi:citrate lyase subunit beta/citryl-CoA lyase
VTPLCVTPLFVPADRPERYAKAVSSGADAVIIDLEDAVAPAAKIAARNALCRPGALPAGADIYIRVNGSQTPWHEADLAAVSGLKIAGVMVPKAESPAQMEIVSACLPGVLLIALIETAAGLAAARALARVPNVARLAFGSIDFCADVGMMHQRDALLTARAELVLASRLAALTAPLDGVTEAINDPVLTENDATYARTLGFGGKLCIHPNQIIAARRGFAPSAAEIAWARRVLAAAGEGAAAVDGAMIDAPVRIRAARIAAWPGQIESPPKTVL